jgi:hypothetical protein
MNMKTIVNNLHWVVGTSLLTGALGVAAVGIVSADEGKWRLFGGDDDEHEEYEEHRLSKSMPVDNSPDRQLYVDECAACHMAYPADFLPERSWRKLMSGLDNHFGENAELDAKSQIVVTDYLVAHSGENSSNRRAKKFLRSINSKQTPLRITELSYFDRKHDEVPDRLVTGNPDVGSFSQCQACHGDKAEQGYFNDDTVDIPNHGRWDD